MAINLEDLVLDRDTVEANIKAFPGWIFDGKVLMKKYEFATFLEAVDFVNRVAGAAETLDHHPDIVINYRRVTLTCMTHKHHAISEADLALVKEIEAVK